MGTVQAASCGLGWPPGFHRLRLQLDILAENCLTETGATKTVVSWLYILPKGNVIANIVQIHIRLVNIINIRRSSSNKRGCCFLCGVVCVPARVHASHIFTFSSSDAVSVLTSCFFIFWCIVTMLPVWVSLQHFTPAAFVWKPWHRWWCRLFPPSISLIWTLKWANVNWSWNRVKLHNLSNVANVWLSCNLKPLTNI